MQNRFTKTLLTLLVLSSGVAFGDNVQSPFRTKELTIGLSTTPANNIKLHRGTSGVQFVPGDDATADGSSATSFLPIASSTLSSTGAVTFGGTTGGALTHTFRSNGATGLDLNNAAGTGSTLFRMQNVGSNTFFINAGTVSTDIGNALGTMAVLASAGGWTFGTTAADAGHLFNGAAVTLKSNNNQDPTLAIVNDTNQSAGFRLGDNSGGTTYYTGANTLTLSADTGVHFKFSPGAQVSAFANANGDWSFGALGSNSHSFSGIVNIYGLTTGALVPGTSSSTAVDTDHLAYPFTNTVITGGTPRFQYGANKNGTGIHGWGTSSTGAFVIGRGTFSTGLIDQAIYAQSSTAGTWIFGPSGTNNFSLAAHTLNGGLIAGGTGTGDQARQLMMATNFFTTGNTSAASRAVTTLTGSGIALDTRTSDAAPTIIFQANKTGVATTGVNADIVGSSTAQGAWTWGTPIAANFSSFYHNIYGGFQIAATSTGDEGKIFRLNSNAYMADLNGATRIGGGSLGGSMLVLDNRTNDGAPVIRFLANKIIDTNTTPASEIGFATQNGGWSFGLPTAGVTHVFNGPATGAWSAASQIDVRTNRIKTSYQTVILGSSTQTFPVCAGNCATMVWVTQENSGSAALFLLSNGSNGDQGILVSQTPGTTEWQYGTGVTSNISKVNFASGNIVITNGFGSGRQYSIMMFGLE